MECDFCSVRNTNKLKPGMSPWPPFRPPLVCGAAYEDPRQILQSSVFHAVALVILYKAVRGHVSEHVMALVVFLLEMAVETCTSVDEDGQPAVWRCVLCFVTIFQHCRCFQNSKMCPTSSYSQKQHNDMDLSSWFTSDSLSDNLRTVMGRIVLTPEPDVSPIASYSSDSKLIFSVKCLQFTCYFKCRLGLAFIFFYDSTAEYNNSL